MSEADRRFNTERFEVFPPAAKNAAFGRLIRMAPTFTIFDLPDDWQTRDIPKPTTIDISPENLVVAWLQVQAETRRASPENELRRRLVSSVGGFLVDFAHTPGTFNALVMYEFDLDYQIGIGKDFTPLNFYYHLLDEGQPESGGLFDRRRAPKVILKCYEWFKEKEEETEEMFEHQIAELGEETLLAADARLREVQGPVPNSGELLRAFEEEYIKPKKG